jgi:hypothetical protein
MQTSKIVFDQELFLLQKEKDTPCLSIILPIAWISPNRQTDIYTVLRNIKKIKAYLQENFDTSETDDLLGSVDELSSEIDFSHNMAGVGLFVSAHVKLWVPFFFPVKEKVILSDSFETRDLLYHAYYATPYHVLLLSKNETRLFKGAFDELEEITDEHFPMHYEDDYEYSTPSRGQAYQGQAVVQNFERDKSQSKKMRFENFLHQIDEWLPDYLTKKDPLIITGSERELSFFSGLSYAVNVIGQLHGNYFYLSVPALGESIWRIIRTTLEKKKQEWKRVFESAKGTDEAVFGMAATWQVVWKEQGACLLVEKDFAYPGYLQNDHPEKLHLLPPDGPHKILPDAVNVLMERVQEKGGEVVILENDALKPYQRIGLLLRY